MLEGMMSTLVAFGPIGFFFAAIIGNASIILPLPIDLIFIPFASVDYFGLGAATPLLLGIIVGTGAAIGELSGYIIGFMGVRSFEAMKKSEVEKIHHIKEKISNKGIPLVAFFAFTPLPFDVVGLAAGLVKYSLKKFFAGCWLGKVPRYVILAYAGYFGMPLLLRLFGV